MNVCINTLEVPTVTASIVSSEGINITWNKIPYADKYVLYQKTNSGKWKNILTTTSTSFLDSNVKDGNEYAYCVRAYKGNVRSDFKSSNSILYINNTDINDDNK